MEENRISRFAKLIKDSKNIVFFGGAGVSTESGLKDYRSEDGLYKTVKQYGVSPETILSRSFFEAHPDIFYDFYYNYFLNNTVEPNRAHFALAQLEKVGRLKAVVTQNIDGLHQRAGSKNVIELHGTVLKHFCPSCKTEATYEQIKALCGKVPLCEKCNRVIKPAVVLYEEPLNEQVITSAIRAISSADLLIIGGTSLAVYPAADFIRYFTGENIVLINREETQYDRRAALVFRDSIGEVLNETVKGLNSN
ncbi:MAG: NAD-dependent protein deacylase [Clostridia bacterium]|nr:NAD-dependent protein deacylase [Clostridia bacterium]